MTAFVVTKAISTGNEFDSIQKYRTYQTKTKYDQYGYSILEDLEKCDAIAYIRKDHPTFDNLQTHKNVAIDL
jgi:hypothetical protein